MATSEDNYPKYKVRGGKTAPKMKIKAQVESKPKTAKKGKKKTSK